MNVYSDLSNGKRGLTVKVNAFLICLAIQYIGVMGSSINPVLSPTKLELLKAIKICDILNPSFQGIAGVICYLSVNIKVLEIVRYSEHTCNYFAISDSCFSGKVYVFGTPSNWS